MDMENRIAVLEREVDAIRSELAVIRHEQLDHANAAELIGRGSRIAIDIVEMKGDISQLQKDMAQVQRDISQLQKDMAQVQRDVSSLQKDIAQVQRDVSSLQKDLPQLQKDISQLQKDMAQMQKDLVQFQAQMQKDLVQFQAQMQKDLVQFQAQMREDLVQFQAQMREDLVQFQAQMREENASTRQDLALLRADFARHSKELSFYATKEDVKGVEGSIKGWMLGVAMTMVSVNFAMNVIFLNFQKEAAAIAAMKAQVAPSPVMPPRALPEAAPAAR